MFLDEGPRALHVFPIRSTEDESESKEKLTADYRILVGFELGRSRQGSLLMRTHNPKKEILRYE